MLLNNRIFGVKKTTIISQPPKPRLNIVQTISELGSSSAYWNFKQAGNYVYAANHIGGVQVIDVSTPASASVIDTLASGWARDMDFVGTTLITCARETTDGYLRTWDISNPASIPVSLDSYTGVAQKFSSVEMDGTDAIVAGQVSGAYRFDVSTPANITLSASNTSGSWETQGLSVANGHAFLCNYNLGLRILDLPTMGGTTDNIVPAPSLNGQALRIWDSVIVGDYLFATTNVTNGSGNAIERGVAILDISSPTATMTAADWILAPVGSHEVDTWNDAGDKPLLGLVHHNGYIFAGNGEQGVAMWHVVNPTRPTYQGLLKGIDVGDNIKSMGIFFIAGTAYLIFGDGARPVPTDGTNKLYIGELII